MSHNKNYRNYSNNLNNNVSKNIIDNLTKNSLTMDNTQESNITDESNNVEVNNVENNKVITGVISNCEKLYMREKNDSKSDFITILDKDSIVTILDDSDEFFYKVSIKNNIIGYCMKKYIKINQ